MAKQITKASKPIKTEHQLIVVGGGLAGLAAALAAGMMGYDVGLVRPSERRDPRTTAIMLGAVNMLKALEVWPLIAEEAAPLERLKIVDITGRLFRAPTALFEASEIGCDAFAYNVINKDLVAAFEARIAAVDKITVYDSEVCELEPNDLGVTLELDNGGEVSGQLVVGADGRNSLVRQSAGLEWHETDYSQVALACHVAHDVAHHHCSVEFHTPSGPCTFVPKQGKQSALVWVMTPEESEQCKTLDDAGLVTKLNELTRHHLSVNGLVSRRGYFPIKLGYARAIAAQRMVLVGEAAHVLPPIGAQGLNLGLRDVASFIDCLAQHGGEDLGSSVVTKAYGDQRRLDLASRRMAADMLNRTLISDYIPAQLMRTFGLNILNGIKPLRTFIMREGMAPQNHVNALFQAKLPIILR